MSLKRALEIIEGGAWISLRFITADLKKGTGSKIIEFAKCRIARNRNPLLAKIKAEAKDGMDGKKFPAHNLHFTRNIELPNKLCNGSWHDCLPALNFYFRLFYYLS